MGGRVTLLFPLVVPDAENLPLWGEHQRTHGHVARGEGPERDIERLPHPPGIPLVDAVAGIADPDTGRPVTSATPFYNFSICKGAASTLVHMLAERGVFT